MKKALALVLALVLALSMAVSAFAANMIELKPVRPLPTEITEIELVEDLKDVLYTTFDAKNWDEDNTYGTVYYFALPAVEYKDLKLTANGNITAELVKYDPETMVVLDKNDNEVYTYSVYVDGAIPAKWEFKEAVKVKLDAYKNDYTEVETKEFLQHTAHTDPRKGGGIDGQRTGGHLRNGDEVGELRQRDPGVQLHHLVLNEGQGSVAAADGKQAHLDKAQVQLQIDHAAAPLLFPHRVRRMPRRAAPRMMKTTFRSKTKVATKAAARMT